MIIRESTGLDIPAIVSLLKQSLGENLQPKSEAFWKWKHIGNPFGQSPVLVALEGNRLIGVRAFMNWEWQYQGRVYRAVRAVDTATAPDFMGKGVFKNLTTNLVERCRADGIDFIFNTPNKSSKPGYLKMGWVSNGRMCLYAAPRLYSGRKAEDFDSMFGVTEKTLTFPAGWRGSADEMTTKGSAEYLKWRYTLNPNVRYYCFSDDLCKPSYLTVFRLKPFRLGIEFRICDAFHADGLGPTVYWHHLREVVRASGANLVSSGTKLNLFPAIRLAGGPEITSRALSVDTNFLTFSFWKPSLGDMEVF